MNVYTEQKEGTQTLQREFVSPVRLLFGKLCLDFAIFAVFQLCFNISVWGK